MKETSAAGVPLLILLLAVAVESIASRTWAVIVAAVSGLAFLGFLIWLYWPRPDERETIRRILSEHPEFRCPLCGQVKSHERTCPVR